MMHGYSNRKPTVCSVFRSCSPQAGDRNPYYYNTVVLEVLYVLYVHRDVGVGVGVDADVDVDVDADADIDIGDGNQAC